MTEEVDDPEWENTIEDAIEAALAELETSFPAVVLSFDLAEHKAEIRPVIRDLDIDPDTNERTYTLGDPISNVPYTPRATQLYGLTFPLTRGDMVWCNAGQRSIDEFMKTGNKDNTPQHPRDHERTDAVIVSIIHPFASKLPATAFAAGKTVLYGPEVLLGDATAVAPVSLSTIVDPFHVLVDAALALFVPLPGDGGLALQTAYRAARLALYGSATPPPVPPSTAATKVKAK